MISSVNNPCAFDKCVYSDGADCSVLYMRIRSSLLVEFKRTLYTY